MIRVGIIGGGQLGQMMILAGVPLGLEFGVLSEHADDPAARLAGFHVPGSLYDAEAIRRLTAWADVTTYEIEHINTDALHAAEAAGATIHPRPEVLERVNDKLLQKQSLAAAGVPIPAIVEGRESYPVVQKLRRGGYDGRGVAVLRSDSDAGLEGEVFYEEAVEIATEIAVIVAMDVHGETSCYSPVEMRFDPQLNICSHVIQPSGLDEATERQIAEVAQQAVAVIGGVGVTAVELFVDTRGNVLVNELAPRPHNSGHLTIEGAVTSQFEQHLRCIVGLPPGDPSARSAAAMVNLLGAPNAAGEPVVRGLDRALAIPGVHCHWYGKRAVRPGRKMGHITVTAPERTAAVSRADEAAAMLRVEGEEKVS